MDLPLVDLTASAAPAGRLRRGVFKVSGTSVDLLGDPDDLYFQGQTTGEESFEPCISIGTRVLGAEDTLLDIGACLGLVSVALAATIPSGRIVAVEPNAAVEDALASNLRSISGPQVTLVAAAIGAEDGRARFHRDPGGSAWGHAVDDDPDPGVLGADADADTDADADADIDADTDVPQFTVDSLVQRLDLDRVDLMKIDVEGRELDVLRGAVDTIERCRPVLVVELNPYCLWRHGRTMPQDLVTWIRQRHTHLWSVRVDGGCTPLVTDADVEALLHRLGTQGGLVDLVAATRPLDLPAELWSPPRVIDEAPDPPVEPPPPRRGGRWRALLGRS